MMAAYRHSMEHHMGIRSNNHQIDNIEFNVF